MASSTANPAAPNLATLLAAKRKLAANKPQQNSPAEPMTVAGAHSKEKITYRQDLPVIEPNPNTTTQSNAPNQSKPAEPTAADKASTNKVSRKTKQLEVDLLDKKMEEIQRKQEKRTNEALESWKGFEDMNYGFYSNGVPTKAPPPTETRPPVKQIPVEPPQPIEKKSEEKPITRVPTPKKLPEESSRPAPKEQEEPLKLTQKEQEEPLKLTPKKQEDPPKPRVATRQPPRPPSPEVKEQEEPPKPIHPPTPPPRRSRSNSHRTSSREKSPEQEPVHTPYQATITPIPLMRSNPKPMNKEPATFLGSTWNPVSTHPFRIFPDIKPHHPTPSQNACKSIQRSMDRYRFYVW